MPQFGIVTSPQNAAAMNDAGFDYVEANVQAWFQGPVGDAEYEGVETYRNDCPLPMPAAALLVPGELKVVGPDVNVDALDAYFERVFRRAGQAGLKVAVFGSGKAREVPDGFDRDEARQQMLDACRLAADHAAKNGVVVALEHLRSAETNLINSFEDAAGYVAEVDHPAFALLVDSYHLWEEGEPTSHVAAHAGRIRHVHIADPGTRAAPGDEQHRERYRDFFAALKGGGYDGRVSIEGKVEFEPDALRRSLDFMRNAWDAA